MTMAMSLMMKNTTSALHRSSIFSPRIAGNCPFPGLHLQLCFSLFFLTVLPYWKLTQSEPKIE